MTNVRYMITTHRGNQLGHGPDTATFVKDVATSAIPSPGDRLVTVDETGDDQINAEVQQTWFRADGDVVVQVVDYQIDPSDEFRKTCDGHYRVAWDTDTNGDLHELLRRCGFVPWTSTSPSGRAVQGNRANTLGELWDSLNTPTAALSQTCDELGAAIEHGEYGEGHQMMVPYDAVMDLIIATRAAITFAEVRRD